MNNDVGIDKNHRAECMQYAERRHSTPFMQPAGLMGRKQPRRQTCTGTSPVSLSTHTLKPIGTGLSTKLRMGQNGCNYNTTRHSCSSVPLKAYISSRLEGKRLSAAPTPSNAYSDNCFIVFCISCSISPSGNTSTIQRSCSVVQLPTGQAAFQPLNMSSKGDMATHMELLGLSSAAPACTCLRIL